ncbi:MAG TPA: hypothetical protein VK454_01575, partial [Myxococcaceae bacterium]|nr:hypothetical protein [Myxococcaceae bacterium]
MVLRAPHRWFRAGQALLLGAALVGARAAPADEPQPRPRSVLVLYSFDPFAPAVAEFDSALHTTLLAEGPPGIALHNEVLDPTADADPEVARRREAWFRVTYGVHPPELVVAAGLIALDFALRERSALWPGAPLVYTGVDDDVATRLELPPDVTGVARRPAVGETLELARRLLPGTRRLAFFGGAGPVDRAFEEGTRRELKRVAGDLELIDLSGLPVDEMAERMATLPPDTIAFGVSLFRDG